MKIDWRVSAIVAGSAFLLSIVIGVIGGVSFGILILRAVIAGVVFGAGAVGVVAVADRYLPELRQAPPSTDQPGRTVDIVVDGSSDPEAGDEGDIAVLDVVEDEGEPETAEEPDQDQDGGFGVLEDVDGGGGTERPFATDAADQSGDLTLEDGIEELSPSDELPQVESLESGFREAPLGDGRIEDVTSSGEDPATMARAIRTVLKRGE